MPQSLFDCGDLLTEEPPAFKPKPWTATTPSDAVTTGSASSTPLCQYPLEVAWGRTNDHGSLRNACQKLLGVVRVPTKVRRMSIENCQFLLGVVCDPMDHCQNHLGVVRDPMGTHRMSTGIGQDLLGVARRSIGSCRMSIDMDQDLLGVAQRSINMARNSIDTCLGIVGGAQVLGRAGPFLSGFCTATTATRVRCGGAGCSLLRAQRFALLPTCLCRHFLQPILRIGHNAPNHVCFVKVADRFLFRAQCIARYAIERRFAFQQQGHHELVR